MHVDHNDCRGRWIIIGGVIGAIIGASTPHMPVAIALGVAAGMAIGAVVNRLTHHNGAQQVEGWTAHSRSAK
jgi:hypothetical protein